jgi:16S rRNA G966 N2-methylase RsmD
MNKYFNINKNKLNKLQIDEIGKYSISKPKDAKFINDIIKTFFKDKEITVTDANGNVGGNTIAFGKSFKKVNSVEFSKQHCDMLKNNIKVFGLKNITVYCNNYLNIMNELKQDVVFIDAPWGGPDYKSKRSVRLFFNDDNNKKVLIENVVNKIKDTKLIILKVPKNLDFIHFFKIVKYKQIVIHNLDKFTIITILT